MCPGTMLKIVPLSVGSDPRIIRCEQIDNMTEHGGSNHKSVVFSDLMQLSYIRDPPDIFILIKWSMKISLYNAA